MATITKDYCSKEIYRLLIEKGFDGEVHTTFDKEGYTQPSITLQMAMKWLREVHNLIIYVKLVDDGDIYHDAWGFVIYNKFTNKYIKSDKLRFKYEEACEAAIKYCLENLI